MLPPSADHQILSTSRPCAEAHNETFRKQLFRIDDTVDDRL